MKAEEQNYFNSNDEEWWLSYQLETTNLGGRIYDVLEYDGKLLLAGGVSHEYYDLGNLALWNGTYFESFPYPVNNMQLILNAHYMNEELVVTGMGDSVAQVLSGEEWTDINNGHFSLILSSKVHDGLLYVVGSNGEDYEFAVRERSNWTILGTALNDRITDLEFFDGSWYVSGEFDADVNGDSLRHIAKLSEGQWVEPGGGLDKSSFDMIQWNDRLLICGEFKEIAVTGQQVRNIAEISGDSIFEMPEYEYSSIDEQFGYFLELESDLIICPNRKLYNSLLGEYQGMLRLKSGAEETEPFFSEFKRYPSSFEMPEIYKFAEFGGTIYAMGDFWFQYNGLDVETFAVYDEVSAFNTLSTDSIEFGILLGTYGFNLTHFTEPLFEFPKGSGNHSFRDAGIWLYGKKGSEKVYGQNGLSTSFTFGPKSFQYDREYLLKYARHWQLTREEVELHQSGYNQSGYVMPEAILNWPAHGDMNKGEAYFLAPFVDVNENDVYEPHLGDYPVIRGDECILSITSDHKHELVNPSESHIDFEIISMHYVYKGVNEILDQTVFVHNQITNRSGYEIQDCKVGQYSFSELTNSLGHVGTDPNLNAFYAYSEPDIGPWNEDEEFINHPPSAGVLFLNRPLEGTVNMAGYSSYTDPPSQLYHFQNYLDGRWRDGRPIIPQNWGYPFGDDDTTETTTFLFHDYPWIEDGWSGIDYTGFQRMIGSTYQGTVGPNESFCFDVAFYQTRNYDLPGALPALIDLLEDAPQIIDFYWNQSEYCDYEVIHVEEQEAELNDITIYPNPTNGFIIVELDQNIDLIEVHALEGNLIYQQKNPVANEQLDLRSLSSGLYIISVHSDNQVHTRRLIIH